MTALDLPRVKEAMARLNREVEDLQSKYAWSAWSHDYEGSGRRRDVTVRVGLLELLLPEMSADEYELQCLLEGEPVEWPREKMISWLLSRKGDDRVVATTCRLSTRENERCLYDD